MNDNKKLVELRRKRGTVKRKLSNFQKYLETTDEIDIIQLNERIDKACLFYDEYFGFQNEIISLVAEDELESEQDNGSEFENLFYAIIANAKQIKNKLNVSVTEGIQPISTNSSKKSYKLPDLNLPMFDGKFEDWIAFHETFSSVIIDDQELEDVHKFRYLRSSLRGEALQVIASLELKASNFQIAWDILKNRYQNERVLIKKHLCGLFELQPVTKGTYSNLRNLIDTALSHVRALESLGEPVTEWSTVLVYLLSKKLDTQSRYAWEASIAKLPHNLRPSFENEFQKFLQERLTLLNATEKSGESVQVPQTHTINHKYKPNREIQSMVVSSNENVCVVCKAVHQLFQCKHFLKCTEKERIQIVKNAGLCFNCLQNGHRSDKCSSGSCKRCSKKHNTLLHLSSNQVSHSNVLNSNQGQAVDEKQISNTLNAQNTQILSCVTESLDSYVFLSTVMVKVYDVKGQAHNLRCLLDCGAQSNFITASAVAKLGLQTFNTQLNVSGFNNSLSQISKRSTLEIKSLHSTFSAMLSCFVVPDISGNIPKYRIDGSRLNVPHHIKLADSNFGSPNKVDILIGANLFWDCLLPQVHTLGKNLPKLQNTVFGWIVTGSIQNSEEANSVACYQVIDYSIDKVQNQLERFWTLEECSNTRVLSKADEFCEKHFTETVQRKDSGRFVVSMPFKESVDKLGDSKKNAIRRWCGLEQKFKKNNDLKIQYNTFMNEYVSLGHMSLVNVQSDQLSSKAYYIPHHAVFKSDSLTTKIRVVFNASASTDTGWSLNQLQYSGPVVQDDLFDILIRFRQFPYVVQADIEKMYRQIEICPDQRHLQRIVWREDSNAELNTFQLNTITYGTASGPYLATRCLKQLALDYSEEYPEACKVILHNFYIDDLVAGFNSKQEAIQICKEIDFILKTGCLNLRKWSSNNMDILSGTCQPNQDSSTFLFGSQENSKTLGIQWRINSDSLSYRIIENTTHGCISKRRLLSEISQVFDPLGYLGPCVISFKIMLQQLWILKLSWDDPVPIELSNQWRRHLNEINTFNDLLIPRHAVCVNSVHTELHGFADASQAAYGCCIYLRSIDQSGKVHVHLLCAKSRVAPLKMCTVPRLELCAALLLANLVIKVREALTLSLDTCTLWSDSQVALCWINSDPGNLQLFVSNRVSQIQQLTKNFEWKYIHTYDNPADLLTRGILPKQLSKSKLWWSGPSWLSEAHDAWCEIVPDILDPLPESKKSVVVCTVVQNSFEFTNFSSLCRLKRVVAYISRFISNCKKAKPNREFGYLNTIELDSSMKVLVRMSQAETFSAEINQLKNHEEVLKGNIHSLSPFLDSEGLLRVGGRLKLSDYSVDKKHPLLVSGKHQLARLIFSDIHEKYCHLGPTQLLATVRERFWITSGRNLAKLTFHQCIRCFKCKPKGVEPVMGELPKHRITQCYPFQICGVDYTGHFYVRQRGGRGSKLLKVYLAIFVCFVSKAVHIETVTDLSTETFLDALTRFIARRGKPSHIYSDNGSNFIGANNELLELGKLLTENSESIMEKCANSNVQWHFIPPSSPHFGGIWESAVKSCKIHLKRVLLNTNVTLERFMTIVTQIEGILNSRPLCPLSSDPHCLEVLTPAHFLIGRTMTSVVDPDITQLPCNRLSAHQHVQQIIQHFWKRWKSEYLSELQKRTKWQHQRGVKVATNQLVLLKDDNLPTYCWKLGRITELHPGNDGVVRVVTVKTLSGIYKRALAKVCPLPMCDPENEKLLSVAS